jgi:hypothetical protein
MNAAMLRSSLTALVALAVLPLFAQGTENAIAAAVLFGILAIGVVIAGLVITVLYVFRRRLWQRVVVLVFGAGLLITGIELGTQPGSSSDIEFLQLLLSGAGALLLLLGALIRARPVVRSGPGA